MFDANEKHTMTLRLGDEVGFNRMLQQLHRQKRPRARRPRGRAMIEVRVACVSSGSGQWSKQVRQPTTSGVMKDQIKFKHKTRRSVAISRALIVCALMLVCACTLTSQQMLMFSSRGHNNERQAAAAAAATSQRRTNQYSLQVPNHSKQLLIGSTSHHQGGATSSALSPMPWRSHQTASLSPASASVSNQFEATGHSEPRGALTRNLYSRGARNASLSGSGASSSGGGGSWHFPRISPEQAAEVLLTGAQVINRIAQADTPLNYCRTPDNQDGECSDIRKCIWLVLDKARLKQSVCLRNLIIPAVCCPVSNANNTPIANMIQSTLEPVLFRPGKGNGNREPTANKHKPSSSSAPVKQQQHQQQVEVEPLPVVASTSPRPPTTPSPASLVIKNPSSVAASSTPASTTSTTTTTTTSTTESPPAQHLASTSGPATSNQLFQDFDHNEPQVQHGTKVNAVYNRTISQKYPWANETCGEGGRARTGRIVGGSDSKLGQWPWMTAMYLNKRSSAFSASSTGSSGAGEFWCGGALINRRFILTAAHCLSDQRGNRYKNDQVTIKLGGVDLVRHQAPADILRNAELGASSSDSSQGARAASSGSPPGQFFATHLDRDLKPARRSTSASTSSQRNSYRSDDDEEFSWTSFITKALGLGGTGSSSGSSSPGGGGGGPSTSPWSSGGGASKALDSQQASKKQQLAAHAKKTYFKEYRVANIKQHPKFQRHGFYNDIGLIELKSDVDYDELVAPVCLPTEHDLKRDLTGYVATVLGWGTLSYGGQGSKLLQQVAMPVWSNKDCDERYLQHIGKTFLCAGFLAGGKDACQGDSGGPLMVGDQTGRWTLHGVVSFGKTCAQAGYPGVYTRVTEYLDWIRDNTDLETYHHHDH